MTFTPAAPFTELLSVYTVTATTGVKSTVGNFLAAAATSTFTTSLADPNYYYQITNEFIGPTKSLDTHSGTVNDAFFSGPLLSFSGQSWYLVPIPGASTYTYLKNLFLGDRRALEGGTTGGTAVMTPIASTGAYFTGQAWTFTPFGNGYTGFRLQNQNVPASSLDAPLADGSQTGLRTTGIFSGQIWYFKRLGHR